MITIDDLKKVEIHIGKILSAEFVEGADKLIKFMIDLGEESPRQILSGIREYYPDPSVLVGRSVPVASNLAPRTIRGFESNGMIMYAAGENGNFCTIEPSKEIPPGTEVR
ncbi:MAG: hypothetical protein WC795_02880 [Candidatus Paceibacterota bacterium]|jgi:methionyl-tRNA synthetase